MDRKYLAETVSRMAGFCSCKTCHAGYGFCGDTQSMPLIFVEQQLNSTTW